MKKVKLLVVLILVFILQIAGSVTAQAAGSVTAQAVESRAFSNNSTDEMSEISLMADEYVTIYRTHNGHRQYRIWNVTKKCWVTDWQDVKS